MALRQVQRSFHKNGLREELLEQKGYRFHYYDNHRPGEAIFLLNGLGATTEFQWYKVLAPFAQRYRTIVVNLLHFGKSINLEQSDYQLTTQVDFVLSLAHALELPRFRLAGISYGGLVGAELAEKFPEKVTGLTLFNAPIKFLDLPRLEALCQMHGAEGVRDFFAPSSPEGLRRQLKVANYRKVWMPRFITNSFYQGFGAPHQKAWEGLVDHLLEQFPALKQKQYHYAGPVTLVWGAEDPIIPLQVGQELEAMYANAQLHVLPQCGHLPPIEQPRKVRQVLLALS